jgi:hypothetical protein
LWFIHRLGQCRYGRSNERAKSITTFSIRTRRWRRVSADPASKWCLTIRDRRRDGDLFGNPGPATAKEQFLSINGDFFEAGDAMSMTESN